MEKVLAPMQVSFPELTYLRLCSYGEVPPVIPDSFLDGSAPRLRYLELDSIPFPGLSKLLLSATHLVELCLHGIPHSGYISPQAMVAPLSVMSSLETLYLGFKSSRSRPDWESPSLSPPKRSILPALCDFHFKGALEYLEELVAHIDTPQLEEMEIDSFYQPDFDCPRLAQFINRTPTLRALDEARVSFGGTAVAGIGLRSQESIIYHDSLLIKISGNGQLPSVVQICDSLPPIPRVENLNIEHPRIWHDEVIRVENTPLLELLLPFTAVKALFLSKHFAPCILDALQELTGARITEVLPSLESIFVRGFKPSKSFKENIGQYVAARQLSDHSITIFWDEDIDDGDEDSDDPDSDRGPI